MMIKSKERYATLVLLDLATRAPGTPVSVPMLAERCGVSVSYLEQLLSRLRRQGLVSAVRGPGGGYRLARDSAGISIAEIVHALGRTPRDTSAKRDSTDPTPELLWLELSKMLDRFLSAISLDDLRRSPTVPPAGWPPAMSGKKDTALTR